MSKSPPRFRPHALSRGSVELKRRNMPNLQSQWSELRGSTPLQSPILWYSRPLKWTPVRARREVSTFQLDRNFQPIEQHAINCVKSGSGNRQKWSFEDNGGGRYLPTYRGDEPSLATVQFSEGSSSKENFGLYKSTWLL